jgi:hypothetical protein
MTDHDYEFDPENLHLHNSVTESNKDLLKMESDLNPEDSKPDLHND